MIDSRLTNSPTTIPYGNAAELILPTAFSLFRPPPSLTLSQYCDEKRYISVENNPVDHGKWHTDRAEYLRGVMDAYNNPHSKYVWVMKSSRSGITEAIMISGIIYAIDLDPCPMLHCSPDKGAAAEFSKKALTSSLRETPGLGEKLPTARSRRGDNTVFFKMFRGGWLGLIWSTSIMSFRHGNTVRRTFAEDVDAWPQIAGVEGDPLTLLHRRAATVWNQKHIIVSSPTVTGRSRITEGYCTSNQQHFYVPCPRCRHKQVLVFGKNSVFAQPTNGALIGGLVTGWRDDPESEEVRMGLQFDKDNCTWAYYLCEHCGNQIEEKQKRQMVRNGEWRKLKPEITEADGCHISEFYSDFNARWVQEAKSFLEAQKNNETLKVWINNVAGETFEEDALTVSDHLLMQRREDYTTVPQGCYMLTCGVDVQHDRLEASVWGWGDYTFTSAKDGRTYTVNHRWLIEHEILYGDPFTRSTWDKLDSYLKKEFRHVSGYTMRQLLGRHLCILSTFVDSSDGNTTNEVYKFTAVREGWGVRAVKGMRGAQKHLITTSKRDKRTRAVLLMLGVSEAKTRLYRDLGKGDVQSDGYVHFNFSANEQFIQQITSEKKKTTYNKNTGQATEVWVLPAGKRNEALDMAVYAYCGKEYLNPQYDKLRETIKNRIEKYKQQITGHPPVEPSFGRRAITQTRRKGWSVKI